jgi:hypothetical protein
MHFSGFQSRIVLLSCAFNGLMYLPKNTGGEDDDKQRNFKKACQGWRIQV